MSTLDRFRIAWSGSAVVGGGVSTLYFETPTASVVADVKNFFVGCLAWMPPSVTVTVPNSGDQIDSATGEIVGTWSSGAPFTGNGTHSSSFYAGGVGARAVWNTLGRTNNRRVRGSTFIVPLAAPMYDTDGTLIASIATGLKFLGDTLITAQTGSMHVWTRPSSAHGGTSSSVVNCSSPDKVTWLRSRRT